MERTEHTGVFRSRINALPMDLREAIGEIPYQIGLRASTRKERLMKLLTDYNIKWSDVGTGTNRFIIKYDGYVIKIALDDEGIADNMQEFAICEALMPNVAYAHEINKGGQMLTATYCPAFTSAREMWAYSGDIKQILDKWSKRFLLGDVGMSNYNYANWGLAPGGKPVCIDYAYIFPSSLNLFECICGNGAMEFVGNSYTKYRCTKCKHEYEDRDLRARISKEERLRLFNNVSGIKMKDIYETHPIDDKYVKYSTDPDDPDIYDVAMTVSDHLSGNPSGGWY